MVFTIIHDSLNSFQLSPLCINCKLFNQALDLFQSHCLCGILWWTTAKCERKHITPWGDWIAPDYRHWHCLLPAWKWQELLLIACLSPPDTSLVSLYKKWVIIGFPDVIKYYLCCLWNAIKRPKKTRSEMKVCVT